MLCIEVCQKAAISSQLTALGGMNVATEETAAEFLERLSHCWWNMWWSWSMPAAAWWFPGSPSFLKTFNELSHQDHLSFFSHCCLLDFGLKGWLKWALELFSFIFVLFSCLHHIFKTCFQPKESQMWSSMMHFHG